MVSYEIMIKLSAMAAVFADLAGAEGSALKLIHVVVGSLQSPYPWASSIGLLNMEACFSQSKLSKKERKGKEGKG